MCCCYPTPNEEGVIVLNANISVTSWRSVLLLEEIGVPRKKPPTCRKSLTNLSHNDNVVSITFRHARNSISQL
jgi:hypothetical protein